MVNKIQILRSLTYGNRPAVGAQPYGTPYVNLADKQIGVVDSTQTPQDLIGVPYFSTLANYNAGQPVNYQGQLYIALANIVAGAWNPANWFLIQAQTTPFDAMMHNGLQVNGGFDVAQVYGSASITFPVNSTGYIADNWGLSNGSGVSMNGGIFVPGSLSSGIYFPSAGRITCPTSVASVAANTYLSLASYIEGYRAARLGWGAAGAQPITISFWIYTTVGGHVSLVIRNNDATRCYVIDFVTTAATWQYFTFTVPGDTAGTWNITNGVGIGLLWTFVCGTTYQTAANTWTAGNYLATPAQSNFFATTGSLVQLTGLVVLPGTNAPSSTHSAFIMRPFDQELLLCKRYYEKSYDYATPPGTATANGMRGGGITSGQTSNFYSTSFFEVAKRATPTVYLYSGGGAGNQFSSGIGNSTDNNASITTSNIGQKSFAVSQSGTPSAGVWYHFQADARF